MLNLRNTPWVKTLCSIHQKNTAISRKVVGKMCTRQSRKVIWDMINILFLTLQLSNRLFLLSFSTRRHISMASRGSILSNFFEEQWTKNHPQYHSGLSRALFPTTFLEIAVYRFGKWIQIFMKHLLPIFFYLTFNFVDFQGKNEVPAKLPLPIDLWGSQSALEDLSWVSLQCILIFQTKSSVYTGF